MANQRAGYSFIEVLIVMMIIGILGTLGAPRYLSSLDRYRVDAASRRIKADLELARRQAKMTSADQPVNFSTASARYELTGMPDLDRPGADYQVDFAISRYPVSMPSVDFDGNDFVSFDQFGRPQSGSPLTALPADGTVVIQSGTRTRTIRINAASGAVNID